MVGMGAYSQLPIIRGFRPTMVHTRLPPKSLRHGQEQALLHPARTATGGRIPVMVASVQALGVTSPGPIRAWRAGALQTAPT